MFLIVIKGSKVGAVFLFDREGIFIIGRGEECDVKIMDLMVSRRHCQIERTRNNYFYIKDLHSTNKTFVNTRMIEDVVKLEVGDIIGVGDTALLFTDQKEIAVKSVEDYVKIITKQTVRIDIPPDQIPQKG